MLFSFSPRTVLGTQGVEYGGREALLSNLTLALGSMPEEQGVVDRHRVDDVQSDEHYADLWCMQELGC